MRIPTQPMRNILCANLPRAWHASEEKRCDGGGESQRDQKLARREQRCLVASAEAKRHKKCAGKEIRRQRHRLDAVRLGQFEKFMNGEKGDDSGEHGQQPYRPAQNQCQHNRNQYDCGRDAFEQGKWYPRKRRQLYPERTNGRDTSVYSVSSVVKGFYVWPPPFTPPYRRSRF